MNACTNNCRYLVNEHAESYKLEHWGIQYNDECHWAKKKRINKIDDQGRQQSAGGGREWRRDCFTVVFLARLSSFPPCMCSSRSTNQHYEEKHLHLSHRSLSLCHDWREPVRGPHIASNRRNKGEILPRRHHRLPAALASHSKTKREKRETN